MRYIDGFFFFFFSSRRRHTRCSRDWSSDVCSSDLEEIMRLFEELHDTGQTIVLVTHEADIAAHASRQIHLRDGLVERDVRSEEHTSELQSRLHLVCRLLLEKKKNKLMNQRNMHGRHSHRYMC